MFEKINTVVCSFCKTFEGTPIHIFYDCIKVKSLWEKLQRNFRMILPCHQLHHILPFLEWLMKQKANKNNNVNFLNKGKRKMNKPC